MPYDTAAIIQIHVKTGKVTRGSGYIHRSPCPKFFCADGTAWSIQASSTHYCVPRNNEGPYIAVEIYNGPREELVQAIGEGSDAYSGEPLAEYPVDKLVEIIDRHGGPSEEVVDRCMNYLCGITEL